MSHFYRRSVLRCAMHLPSSQNFQTDGHPNDSQHPFNVRDFSRRRQKLIETLKNIIVKTCHLFLYARRIIQWKILKPQPNMCQFVHCGGKHTKSTYDTFETGGGKSFFFFHPFHIYVVHRFSGSSPRYTLHYTV